MNMLVEEDIVFHVNWGWGGFLDGWFYLGHLQPDDKNYSGYRWEMIFKIAPQGWISSVENITQQPRLGNGDIYNILGMKIERNDLQHECGAAGRGAGLHRGQSRHGAEGSGNI